LGKKIRNAELQKIPFILVVGDKEKQNQSVNVRQREKGNLGEMTLEKFTWRIGFELSSIERS
jgi:threonyl-tRNA synthetase